MLASLLQFQLLLQRSHCHPHQWRTNPRGLLVDTTLPFASFLATALLPWALSSIFATFATFGILILPILTLFQTHFPLPVMLKLFDCFNTQQLGMSGILQLFVGLVC